MEINDITYARIITLITIYDNYHYVPTLQIGWGFSCLIKLDDKAILFDTGGDSPVLLYNMEKLKIKPEEINIVVLSHIHGDHVGGLSGFLEKNNEVKVYLQVSFPTSFNNEIKSYGADLVEVSEATKIYDDVWTIGELGTWIKEQSLIINTNKGIVLITGCAHPGVVNIIKKVKELTNDSVYLVIGGFHLTGASDSELHSIIESFRELDVKKVAPCHCSGDRCHELFKKEYKNDFIENGVGKIINIS